MMNIIARKPADNHRTPGAEYAVVKVENPHHPYVSCTVTPHSMKYGGWYAGNYFKTLESAMAHFNGR